LNGIDFFICDGQDSTLKIFARGTDESGARNRAVAQRIDMGAAGQSSSAKTRVSRSFRMAWTTRFAFCSTWESKFATLTNFKLR
jgi:hypothetical protein